MISTEPTYLGYSTLEEYEENRVKRLQADGALFVPEGPGEKWYVVACENDEDWKYIHDRILENNCPETYIPTPHKDCVDESKSCGRIGSFLLDDAEAEELRNHSKVISVALDKAHYEGTFSGLEDLPTYEPIKRFGRDVLIQRAFSGAPYYWGVQSQIHSGKTGASIYRHSYRDDPWSGQSTNTAIYDDPQSIGDGTDVDVIVCDESGWYGHAEFVKTGYDDEPQGWTGENVLKSGFAASATTGVCSVLDMVLDAPYYLDPDFFEANPAARLTQRWDGTTVPVESVARSWWTNESTSFRSAKYVSTDIPGGTATPGSPEDFGSITVNTAQTRANSNGSNTAEHTSSGYHATPCMSQAYGKTCGFAYNSNKWHMSIIWRTGSQSISNCFRILKVFHQLKPNRASDNTKNPSIVSHSWGRGRSLSYYSTYYYYYRQAGDGTGGVTLQWTAGSPNFWSRTWRARRHEVQTPVTDSEHILGAACIDAGIIWCVAAGNNNQKQVLDGHADYDNYYGYNNNTTLATAKANATLFHRIGFPASCGLVENYQSSGVDKYRAFNVGALNSDKYSNTQERKASYSNMGNGIDYWAIGDNSMSAGDENYTFGSRVSRYHDTYTLNGQTSMSSKDIEFGGTSSACPVSVGILATKLQYNRTWTWQNVKEWLQNEVTNTSTMFSEPNEATSATDSNWLSYTNIQGNNKKILWDAATGSEPATEMKLSGSGLSITGVDLNIA